MVEHEYVNKMGVNNVSVVFGPTIIRSPRGIAQDLSESGSYIKVSMRSRDMHIIIDAKCFRLQKHSCCSSLSDGSKLDLETTMKVSHSMLFCKYTHSFL